MSAFQNRRATGKRRRRKLRRSYFRQTEASRLAKYRREVAKLVAREVRNGTCFGRARAESCIIVEVKSWISKQRAVSVSVSVVHRFRHLAQGTDIYNIIARADDSTRRIATFYSTLLASCCCRPRWSRFPSLYRYTPRRRTTRHHWQRRSILRTRSTTPSRLRARSETTLTRHCVAALPSPEVTMQLTTLCATTGTFGKTRLNSDDPILDLWRIP